MTILTHSPRRKSDGARRRSHCTGVHQRAAGPHFPEENHPGIRARKIEGVSQQFCLARRARRTHRIGIVCHVEGNATTRDCAAIALRRVLSFTSVGTAHVTQDASSWRSSFIRALSCRQDARLNAPCMRCRTAKSLPSSNGCESARQSKDLRWN